MAFVKSHGIKLPQLCYQEITRRKMRNIMTITFNNEQTDHQKGNNLAFL